MTRSSLVACVCFAFASLAPSAHATDEEVVKDIAAGDEAKQRWDYAEAIKCFSRALEKDPLNVEALAYRGFMYCRTGELDRALTDTTLAIQVDPKYARAYVARGTAFSHRDDLDKAIADLSEAVRLDPNSSNYVGMRADLYFRQGDVEKALTDYNRAVELDPESAANFCSRGDLRVSIGDYTGAASDYLRAQALDPKYSAPYIAYAWLLATCADAQIRDSAKALQYAKIGLDLNPKREDAWVAYAAALAAAGRFDEAVEWQQRYASSKVLSEAARIQAASTLALYKSHHSPIQPPPPAKKN